MGTSSRNPPPNRTAPMTLGSTRPARNRVEPIAVPPIALDRTAAITPWSSFTVGASDCDWLEDSGGLSIDEWNSCDRLHQGSS